MTDKGKELFNEVFKYFQASYPNTSLEMVGTMVYSNGEAKFNTDGFNLAYNLHRLIGLLIEAGELR